jgi:MFS transporter, putative metabolite:H+ symporter
MEERNYKSLFSIPLIVAALGYFVDIYDLLLFTIVKAPSMRGVGATDLTMLADSTRVINWQMTGLLIGGIAWGVLEREALGVVWFHHFIFGRQFYYGLY